MGMLHRVRIVLVVIYQHFWDVVGPDVIICVHKFLQTGALWPNFNSTILRYWKHAGF